MNFPHTDPEETMVISLIGSYAKMAIERLHKGRLGGRPRVSGKELWGVVVLDLGG